MTPMLILVFGVAPVTAIGTDLAYAAVTKTVGGYKHWSLKTVDFKLSTWMAVGSVPAAICGVYVLTLLEDLAGRDFDNVLLNVLAVTLLITGAATSRARLPQEHARARTRDGRDGAPPQGRGRGARAGGRLRARGDLGRIGSADRHRADPALSARSHPSRGHGRISRSDSALGRRHGPHRGRQRRLRARGQHPASARFPASGWGATGRCEWSLRCCARPSPWCSSGPGWRSS